MTASPLSSKFFFTVCQVGAEKSLKEELTTRYPHLRFSFSRPGFVTFKSSDPAREFQPQLEIESVFARAYGLSMGKILFKDKPVTEAISELFSHAKRLAEQSGKPKLRLHFWKRDHHKPGEEPQGWDPGAEVSR